MHDLSDQRKQYRFGSFELDLKEGELRRQGTRIKLNEKPFRLLCVLLESAGHLVTRDELRQRLWTADTYVDFDANLNTALSTLRHTLGDSSDSPIFVETVPRQGYRFIAPVTEISSDNASDSNVPAVITESAQAMPRQAELQVAAPTAPEPKRRKYLRALVAAAMFLFITAFIAWFAHVRWVRVPRPAATLTVLVTPFENLSGDSSQDYLSDGLTDEMITRLGQISPSHLRVISRSTAMQYKHTQKSMEQIARECQPDYILEGSVRRQGDHIRITAQLFKVGEQGSIWTEAYEREAKDLLVIQQDVADRIAHSLSVEVFPSPSQSIPASSHAERHSRELLPGNVDSEVIDSEFRKDLQDLAEI